MASLCEHELAALVSWCERSISGFAGPISLQKFDGGQSNPTYLMLASRGRYVLRRRPVGNLLPSAHAVDREFRLMSALGKAGFAVPRTFALCRDESIIGSEFYIMAAVEGLSFSDGALPGLSMDQRGSVYRAMTSTLADLHRIDPGPNGLADYGKSGNYFERQVSRWSTQYCASRTERLADMDQLTHWLGTTVPRQSRTTIVHGDYRIDNLIFSEASSVEAVLDWELSTLGDPLADLSYYALSWVMPPDGRAAIGGLDLAALGIPKLEEVLDIYCARSGLSEVPDLKWYFAFNLFRYVAILQGVKKRALDGNASNVNTATLVARIPDLAALACRFAEESSPHARD